MHRFRDISKNVFQRIFEPNFVIFKHVSRLTGLTLLIFNTSMSTSALSLTIEYLIVAKKYIFIFLTPSFKGKNFEAGVSKGGHFMHSMHRFRLP